MSKESDYKIRIKLIGLILSIFIFVLAGRLYNLAVVRHREYVSMTKRQLHREVKTYFPRGQILDRKGIPFTGEIYMEEGLALPAHGREDSIASHIIGQVQYKYKDNTVNGLIGVSGVQKQFNEELKGGLPLKIIQYKDGHGKQVSRDAYYVYGDHINNGENIKLTLDYHIQKVIDNNIKSFIKSKSEIISLSGIAVVVIDVNNGEVLGMSSIGDQSNKALYSYPMGSIFKTLVASKAIEKQVVDLDEKFFCAGSFLIEDQIKDCHKTEGHGEITFKEAFAESCNSVFNEVAQRLNIYNPNGTVKGNEVLELAKEFGFSAYSEKAKDSFILADKYSSNTIPDTLTCEMDIYNMALGQGKIETNPLMATKIMATVANDGLLYEPILIKEISTSKGEVLEKFENKRNKQIISKEINKKLKLMLEEVVDSGTARRINIETQGVIAGKTGTAENGQVYPHSWFSGYFPRNKPKYAMTVFVENGGSGSAIAVPLFEDIAKDILNLGKRN